MTEKEALLRITGKEISGRCLSQGRNSCLGGMTLLGMFGRSDGFVSVILSAAKDLL